MAKSFWEKKPAWYQPIEIVDIKGDPKAEGSKKLDWQPGEGRTQVMLIAQSGFVVVNGFVFGIDDDDINIMMIASIWW